MKILIVTILLFPLLVSANIREQRVDENGIYIKASNGKEITIKSTDMMGWYNDERLNNPLATKAENKSKAEDKVKQRIVEALGAEQIDINTLNFDYNPDTGKPDKLESDENKKDIKDIKENKALGGSVFDEEQFKEEQIKLLMSQLIVVLQELVKQLNETR